MFLYNNSNNRSGDYKFVERKSGGSIKRKAVNASTSRSNARPKSLNKENKKILVELGFKLKKKK